MGVRGGCIVWQRVIAHVVIEDLIAPSEGQQVVRPGQMRQYPIGFPHRSRRELATAATTTALGVWQALQGRFGKAVEVIAADSFCLDLTSIQSRFNGPEEIAATVRDIVEQASGRGCLVGLSGDRTTARLAASDAGSKGIGIVPPWMSCKRLQWLPIEAIAGVGPVMAAELHGLGIDYCGQMRHLSMDGFVRRYGDHGRRVWLRSQGREPVVMGSGQQRPQTITFGKIMSAGTTDIDLITAGFKELARRMAEALRRRGFVASQIGVTFALRRGQLTAMRELMQATQSADEIESFCRDFLQQHWSGQGVFELEIRGGQLSEERGAAVPEVVSGAAMASDRITADIARRLAIRISEFDAVTRLPPLPEGPRLSI